MSGNIGTTRQSHGMKTEITSPPDSKIPIKSGGSGWSRNDISLERNRHGTGDRGGRQDCRYEYSFPATS
jgi:hypothetical protein